MKYALTISSPKTKKPVSQKNPKSIFVSLSAFLQKIRSSLPSASQPYYFGAVSGQSSLIQTKKFLSADELLRWGNFWAEITCTASCLVSRLFAQTGAATLHDVPLRQLWKGRKEINNNKIIIIKKKPGDQIEQQPFVQHHYESAWHLSWVKLPGFLALRSIHYVSSERDKCCYGAMLLLCLIG